MSSLWEQIGSTIPGANANETEGSQIVTELNDDGDIIVVGSPYDDANGNESGSVKVYQNISGTWTQIGQTLLGSDTDDKFGYSVAINGVGNVIAVSAPNDGPSNAGIVRVYEYIESEGHYIWSQVGGVGTRDLSDDHLDSFFGHSISLNASGNTVVVGAKDYDIGGNNTAGAVLVFSLNDDNWELVGNEIEGNNIEDNFGYRVKLNGVGNIVAVSAISGEANGGALNAGLVKVYQYVEDDTNDWVKMGQNLGGEATGDGFGSGIDLNTDGDIIAIGAPRNDNNGNTDAGYVQVYQFTGGSWEQIGDDIVGDEASGEFGTIVSLNSIGDTLAISGPFDDTGGANSGVVKVYKNIGSTWTQLGQSITGGTSFAVDVWVSLNSDGTILAIGSENFNNGVGRVRVFELTEQIQQGSSNRNVPQLLLNGDNNRTIFMSTGGSKIVIVAIDSNTFWGN